MAKAVLSNKNTIDTVYIENKDFNKTRIFQKLGTVKINQDLPFRVRFTTIGIEGYGPGNVPPIGIAVIGFNNYIL